MKMGYKIWLDRDGKAFGDGPYELLTGVKDMHSLHQAAKGMGMAYSKAWRLVRVLEKRLGFALLERKIGGISGGGSRITPEAENLMRRYERFRIDVEKALSEIYQRHFGPAKKGGSR